MTMMQEPPWVLTYTGLPSHHLCVLVNNPRNDGHSSAAAPKAVTVNCLGRGGRGPGVIVILVSLYHDQPSSNIQPIVGGVLLGLLL